jgi:hypothetical protein
VREFTKGQGLKHATLTFQFPDILIEEDMAQFEESSEAADDMMNSMANKEVYFDVLFSARWHRFVAFRVILASKEMH